MDMGIKAVIFYEPPFVEIVEVEVEKGFGVSSTPSTPSITPGTDGTGSNMPWG